MGNTIKSRMAKSVCFFLSGESDKLGFTASSGAEPMLSVLSVWSILLGESGCCLQ